MIHQCLDVTLCQWSLTVLCLLVLSGPSIAGPGLIYLTQLTCYVVGALGGVGSSRIRLRGGTWQQWHCSRNWGAQQAHFTSSMCLLSGQFDFKRLCLELLLLQSLSCCLILFTNAHIFLPIAEHNVDQLFLQGNSNCKPSQLSPPWHLKA